MPKRKVPKTWQTLERKVADMLSPLFGMKLFRNPLSGANNRTDSGQPRRGDIILPEWCHWIIECKYRSGIAFHRFYDQAVNDAEKAGFPLRNVLVFSKEKGNKPILATLEASKLLELLEVVHDNGQIESIFGSGNS